MKHFNFTLSDEQSIELLKHISVPCEEVDSSRRLSLDMLLYQLRTKTNPVTRSVLVDCIIDRLKRKEFS